MARPRCPACGKLMNPTGEKDPRLPMLVLRPGGSDENRGRQVGPESVKPTELAERRALKRIFSAGGCHAKVSF